MSKAARQRTARDRLAEERKRQAERQQRFRVLGISIAAVVVIALIVGGGIFLTTQKEERTKKATAYTGPLAPVSRENDGSVVMAANGVSAPLLEIFEDFQCPICNEFEKASGQTIEKLAASGKVKVVYRPFQLFQGKQREPLSSNSRRAANAALCVPADKWVSYHNTLYKYQPAEGSKGFSDDDLIGWGRDLGVTDAGFAKCVTDQQKGGQLDAMTKYATSDRHVDGTPTVFLNGKQLDLQSQLLNPQVLERDILAAAGKATPAPSGSPSAK